MQDSTTLTQITDSTALVQVAKEAVATGGQNLYFLIACALLGAVYHFNSKAKRLMNQAGYVWDTGMFFKKEAPSIVSSLIIITVCVIAKESVTQLKYGSMVAGNWMYFTFFVIGYFGDSIVDKLFGGYEKKLEQDSKPDTDKP